MKYFKQSYFKSIIFPSFYLIARKACNKIYKLFPYILFSVFPLCIFII